MPKTHFKHVREYRIKTKNNIITDISYKELVNDSLGIIQKIYKTRNIEITPKLQKIFIETEQTNPQGKYGHHKYSPEDFGIDNQFINEFTLSYQQFQEKLNLVQSV